MIRRKLYNYFFLMLLAGCLYGIAKLLAPFSGALLGAVFCGVVFYPLHEWLKRWIFKGRPAFRAALAESVVLIFFIVPSFFTGWAIVNESKDLNAEMRGWAYTLGQLRRGNVSADVPLIGSVRAISTETFGVRQAEFKTYIAEHASQALDKISHIGTAIAQNTMMWGAALCVMLLALFFVFRDGVKFLNFVGSLIPMRRGDKETLLRTLHDTFLCVARGVFFTSLAQGALAALGYTIVGADGAILLGVLTALTGLIPIVGTFGVWVPVSVYYFSQGALAKGAFVFIWGAVVVMAFCDGVLRPYLVGKRTRLHFFALFLALLGGLEAWGVKGLLIGPALVAILPQMLKIYGDRYLRRFQSKKEMLSVYKSVPYY